MRRAAWGCVSIALATVVCALPATVHATPTASLVLDSSFSSLILGPRVSVLVDAESRLAPATIRDLPPERFTACDQAVPTYGYTEVVHWFRIVTFNPRTAAVDWRLEVAQPHLNELDLYGPSATDPFHHAMAGDMRPFHVRDVVYRNPTFAITTPPGTHVYFLRVHTTGSLTVPMTARSPRAFFDHVNAELPALWMFYGLMVAMALYNLFVFFAVRDRTYFYYVLYIASFTALQFSLNGFAYQYLWPNASLWENRFLLIAVGLTCATAVQFSRRFVELHRHMPRFDRVIAWLGLGGGALTIVGAGFLPMAAASRVSIVIGLSVAVTGLPGVTWLAFQGNRQARFHVVAWIVLLAGLVLYALRSLGLVPTNALTMWTIQIGAALEVVLLSLGLADRINVMRRHLGDSNQALGGSVQRLKVALQRADDARLAKGAFYAAVSHELRTPLNAIINIPEGLLEQYRQTETMDCQDCGASFDIDEGEHVDTNAPCPDCGKPALTRVSRWVSDADPAVTVEHLKLVQRSGNHLLEVVSDILDISKIESGKMVLHRETTDVAALARDTTAPLREQAAAKGIQVELDLPGEPRTLSVDPHRLKQALGNLVGNAIKFSHPRGTVRVELRDEGDRLRIGVHDQGLGIADKDKPHIFERFNQAHTHDTRRFGGTGLGLAISKQLIELHGGELWFDSAEGRGSDFYIRLPVAPHSDSPAFRQPQQPPVVNASNRD